MYMRRIRLTEEEKQQLENLYKTSPNSVVRERSFCLLLSNKGHNLVEIAAISTFCRQTLSTLLNAWESASSNEKLATLRIDSGRGAKVKLNSVKDLLPDMVKTHSRNLNPILELLEKEHNIKVCKLTLHNFLKGTGL